MPERVELIIQYVGDLKDIQEQLGFVAVELLGGYAVIRIASERISELEQYPEIIYTETPSRLFFEVNEGKAESCINEVQALPFSQSATMGLDGSGVLVAIIDSGIDYFHPDFRRENGDTRILALWDQSIPPGQGGIGEAYLGETELGYVYTEDMINQALQAESQEEGRRLVPSQDYSGHGTHVAGIAAGNGRAGAGKYRGVAYASDLLVVKLGRSLGDVYPQTAGLMEAVDYVIRIAMERRQPVAINISFGNNEGAHNGRSILESYLSAVAQIGQVSIQIGTGNEGTLGRHQGGRLQTEEWIELAVGEGEQEIEFWFWKNYFDRFQIELIAPDGNRTGNLLPEAMERREAEGREYTWDSSRVRMLYQGPTPYNPLQQLQFAIEEGTSGIWQLHLTPERIVTGEYDIWLNGAVISRESRFLRPTEYRSLTIPSTAGLPVSVGAYDGRTEAVAYFSGRGYPRAGNPEGGTVKPDLVAPGVDVMSAAPGGGYTIRSGTSMATPFVTGVAALLMQWGIVKRNDRRMYGQRLKASLLRAARRREDTTYPNEREGWGRLCLGQLFR